MNKLILLLPVLLFSCDSFKPKEGYRISTYSADGEVANTYLVSDYDSGDNGIYIMVGGKERKISGSFKIEKFVKP